ncbi:prepilin peptidase [Flexivirga oryzae]|uniref:Leader peptidase (Prepilin peptidase)/N-methyltransferase n=1 Tax=Flexivirga oryzae TaxID=1794944 RepID=A0A839N7Z7_9MICO|nr:prepilin peptidase [Flexivirga oryzae]MBB2892134.1 leader peptidase (prepilin peptidase)/N-methyltransferase [Flexivirga oryzae]
MDTAGFTVAAALVGVTAGVLSVRNLRALRYRYDYEAVLPQPSSVAWVLPTAVIAAVALGLRLSPDRPWALLLLAPLAIAGPWLAAVDLDVHRLPDRVLGPVAVASLLAVVVVSAATHRFQVPVLGVVGLVLAGGCYFTLHVAGGGAVGLGDVKLAAVLGLALGAVGLGVLWWAMLLSSLLCLVWVAVTRRGKSSSTRIAFGPWMLLGSLIAVAVFAP